MNAVAVAGISISHDLARDGVGVILTGEVHGVKLVGGHRLLPRVGERRYEGRFRHELVTSKGHIRRETGAVLRAPSGDV